MQTRFQAWLTLLLGNSANFALIPLSFGSKRSCVVALSSLPEGLSSIPHSAELRSRRAVRREAIVSLARQLRRRLNCLVNALGVVKPHWSVARRVIAVESQRACRFRRNVKCAETTQGHIGVFIVVSLKSLSLWVSKFVVFFLQLVSCSRLGPTISGVR